MRVYASASATTVAFTMSSTVAPRLRSQTGLRNPCRIGPNACAPASSCASLYAMFPESRSGKISTFASPAPSPFFAATLGFSAASPWTGPTNPVASAAARTLSTLSPAPELPVENDNSATRASPNSAVPLRSDARAISASASASGDTFSPQSAKINSRPSGNRIRKNDDGSATSGAKPIAMLAASMTFLVDATAPATIASASPAATIAAARYNGRASMRRAKASFMPRASTKAATSASVTPPGSTGSQTPSARSRSIACAIRSSSASGNTTRAFCPFARSRARFIADIHSPFSLRRRQR